MPSIQQHAPRLAAFGLILATSIAMAGGSLNAGIELRTDPQAAEIGLPLYPGALPQRADGDDSAGVKLGLWGGSLGFHLAVIKLSSNDSVDAVAAFYREALAQQGPVLECGTGASEPAKGKLRCDDDRPKPGGKLYKAGRPGHFRLVAVEPAGRGAHFVLVRIDAGSE